MAVRPDEKAGFSFAAIMGVIFLTAAASVYATFGISAFPRQEWIVETLAAGVFLIPVVHLLRGPGSRSSAVRLLGGMLLAHSFWDALHWPGHAWIHTPLDPWIPRICPWLDVPVGFWLLIRGR